MWAWQRLAGLAWPGLAWLQSLLIIHQRCEFLSCFFGTQMCKVKSEKQKTRKDQRKEIKINENENGCRWQFYSLFGQIVVRRGAGGARRGRGN